MSRSLSWIDANELNEAMERLQGAVTRPPKVALPIPEQVETPAFAESASVSQRATEYVQWAVRSTGAEGAFVVDADGLPIVMERATEAQALTSVALDRALRSVRPFFNNVPVGAVTLSLEDGRWLLVIWAPTRIGRAAVGLMKRSAVDLQAVPLLREGLRRLFEW